MMPPPLAARALQCEERFHDLWAERFDPARVPVDESFSVAACPENLYILRALGDLRGKRVLDLGAGQGEAATYFAKQGARVVGADLSRGMLALARRVARLHRAEVAAVQMDAARLPFPSGHFDVVYGANVLHHADMFACLAEVRRVLKPGGKAAFWDPLRYNPLINAYRRMAHQVRSTGEAPLGRAQLRRAAAMFAEAQAQTFWLAALAVFLKFYFVDQVHPNEERYWKKVIVDYDHIRGLHARLAALDRLLLRLPGVRWLAWNVAVVYTR